MSKLDLTPLRRAGAVLSQATVDCSPSVLEEFTELSQLTSQFPNEFDLSVLNDSQLRHLASIALREMIYLESALGEQRLENMEVEGPDGERVFLRTHIIQQHAARQGITTGINNNFDSKDELRNVADGIRIVYAECERLTATRPIIVKRQ